MLIWTPSPSVVPWHEVQEDEVWAAQSISAVDDSVPPLTVMGYSVAVIGSPIFGLVTSSSSAGLLVSAPASLVGSFPPINIEYQIKRVTGNCLTFIDLPSAADEVIQFVPHPVGVKSWTLSVTATLSDGATGSADFILMIYSNFTIGRNALVEAVNARRK